jgi:hypothetical protein
VTNKAAQTMSVLRFSHEVRTYVFRGKELTPPKPGTYDPTKWTPPTHQIFTVSIQVDGLWTIKLNGVVIQTGDGAKRSRTVAEAIIWHYCRDLLT